MPLKQPTTTVTTTEQVRTETPWNVIVWDDPVTLMSVVETIFQKVFGYPREKCTHLMLTVHHEGKAVVWSGARDRAQDYCVKLQVAGLQATIEQVA
jgi:ATP-dependent Clp protease adaptor protein ClpS